MKNMFLIATVLGFATLASAGDRVGLAEGTNQFDITRDGVVRANSAQAPSEVQLGDVVGSRNGVVRVEMNDGTTLMVAEKGAVQFAGEGVNVQDGNVAVSVPKNSTSSINWGGLTFRPAEATEAQNLAVLAADGSDMVRMETVNSKWTVENTSTGKQVAFLGAGDSMLFTKDQAGEWVAVAPKQGAPGDFTAQDTTGGGESAAAEDDDSNEGAIILVGAVAAAAGGAWYWYYKSDDSEDDNHRRDKNHEDDDDNGFQGPFSPIGPGIGDAK